MTRDSHMTNDDVSLPDFDDNDVNSGDSTRPAADRSESARNFFNRATEARPDASSNAVNVVPETAPNHATEDASAFDITSNEEDVNDREHAAMIAQRNRRSKRTKALFGSGAVVVALCLGVGMSGLNPFTKVDAKPGSTATSTVTNPAEADPAPSAKQVSTDDFWNDSAAGAYPVKLEPWEKTSYGNSTDKDRKAMLRKYQSTEMAQMTNLLPSEATGFTSDLNKRFNSDGTPNVMFSYLTRELVQQEIESTIERFTNPVYGDWASAQYASYNASKNFPVAVIGELFTSKWYQGTKGKQKKDYIPLFLDWNSNDYGMSGKLLPKADGAGRWMGDVTSVTVNPKYNKANSTYTFDVTAKVTFKAWTVDQETVEKKGTLKLFYVTANQNEAPSHRILIDSASLDME